MTTIAADVAILQAAIQTPFNSSEFSCGISSRGDEEKTMIAYKLLNPNLTTYGGCQWVIGEKKTTSGDGELCGPGWLHGYEYAEIAHFLNPIHANFTRPVLYRVEAGGRQVRDGVLKSGWTEMTLLEPVDLPQPTLAQRVRFALACAVSIYREPSYLQWATHWFDDMASTKQAAAWAARTAAAAWAARTAETVAAWAARTAETAASTKQAAASTKQAAARAARAAAAAWAAATEAWAVATEARTAVAAATEARTAVAAATEARTRSPVQESSVGIILQAARFALSDAVYPPWLIGKDKP